MSKNLVILIAGSANTTGLNVIKSLYKFYRVIGTDYDVYNPANQFCENYVVPPCSDSRYIDCIFEIIMEQKVTHIIPTNDHTARALYLINDRLESLGITLNGYGSNMLNCLDKQKTYELFRRFNILTPKIIKKGEQFKPFVLRKKEMGNAKKFLHIVKKETEIDSIAEDDFLNGVMTEYIDGPEFTVDVLCDNQSNVIYAVPRERIEVKGGMVWHGQTINDKILINQVVNIAKLLQLKGIACIQCIKSDNSYYFIEINPRPGSGIDLSINAGVNIPYYWIKNTLGETLPSIEPEWNMHLIRYYSGYFFKS